ncbi:MAG TPA: glycosyltransferase [Candidatus Nesterenkonia stercoripullorum]|uniref:Glycosyltransferase n=1 Tax=Candidatus Nesterenkonia stercoripullorum TaxID=2838701 RepID=A0A9D1UUV4_9MICC|nr:glycosyltransferase [Candidatus Nesterenkonia stercoripullorum]
MTTPQTPSGRSAPLRVAMLSLHTSPLAQAGSGDAGGLNVYVDALSRALQRSGTAVEIVTTTADASRQHCRDETAVLADGRIVHTLALGDRRDEDKNDLVGDVADLARRALARVGGQPGNSIDLIHSHYWISGLAGLDMAAELGVPLVHTMHTIGAVKTERDPGSVEDPRRASAEARIAARAAALTANTQREAADLERLFGAKKTNLAVIPPGVDLEIFSPSPAARPAETDGARSADTPAARPGGDPAAPLAAQAGLRGEALRLTFAGRLQRHKGPQVAIEAVARLLRDSPQLGVHLTIAGQRSGADFDAAALISRLGMDDHVTRLPALPHDELAALFRVSDAVLVPSYSESFGLVALEAMACGAPVLAHRVGGLADLVIDGETGWLIDSLDSRAWAAKVREVAELKQGPARTTVWNAVSAAAARRSGGFSWDISASLARDLYQRVTSANEVRGSPEVA